MQSSREFYKQNFQHFVDATREVFTPQFIRANQSPSGASPTPIFVVGMMRSGTTLVEQILSSHPDVAGGNEIAFWVRETFKSLDAKQKKFDVFPAMGSRKKYNRLLKQIAPNARFVTDKMPDNYRVLGAIHMLYPEAKIIHCTRHPVDTCLSLLTTPFRKPPEYGRDPELLAFVYKSYRELMRYWREVLPATTMMEVRYETLVSDPERVTRKLIEFCGLEWNEACLRPQDNLRPVLTASVWQARQPVYTSSVGRWKNYEPWLGPLAELLTLEP